MNRNTGPLFSVIIPCYNQAHFLRDAIDSALRQVPSPEVIVVNDGSTDETSEIAQSYGAQVHLIQQDNSGLPAARNAGILKATGEFLLFLDSDDAIRPGMLSVAKKFIEEKPDVDILHGIADVTSPDLQSTLMKFGGVDLGVDPFHRLLAGNIGPPNTFIVRRTLFSRSGLFNPSLKSCEDWDMWLRLAANGAKFALCPDMVSVYRDVPGSMSKHQERMWRHTVRVINLNRHMRCAYCNVAARMAIRASATSVRPMIGRSLKSRGDLFSLLKLFVRNPKLAFTVATTLGFPSRGHK